MIRVVDDRGVVVQLQSPPRRIVSLVPSTTETLFDLGLGGRVVGVTRFCVHPEAGVRGLPKVGGTKDVDRDRLAALAPDLIVGNCEENTREIFEALAGVAPVYAAFPRDVDGALADLIRLGALVGAAPAAEAWAGRIAAARAVVRTGRRARAAYLIWREPWMSVSRDTFVHHMLDELGFDNVFADRTERYPVITLDELRDSAPDRVLLSDEPFPFAARHADELATATGLPLERFVRVSGEDFTWHGTHLAGAFARLAERQADLLP